jgi:TPR repeat protein
MRNIFVGAALSLALVTAAHAQPAACHALAASPADPTRKGPGVSYAKIDAARAVPACQSAVNVSPKDGQLWFQYGRALEKANRVSDAIVAYQKGIDLDNPGALNNLGELYRDGKGVTRNPYLAEVLFQNAAIQDFPEAVQNLNALEKNRPPLATRTIPAPFRGKFALPDQTCQQTIEMSKAFGGDFMGIEVAAQEVNQPMELMCTVLNVNVEGAQQARVILKCSRNSPEVSLFSATLTPNAVRFESNGQPNNASVRCFK